MRQLNIPAILRDLETCPELSYNERRQHGIAPNEIKFFDGRIFLIARQSTQGEHFSVSEGAVKYCRYHEDTFNVQGYVILVDRDGNFVAQTTIKLLERAVSVLPAQPSDQPQYGPYWWISEDFEIAPRARNNRNPQVNKAPWE